MESRLRHMLETSARLLKLLSLLQVRRDWTGPELADRLSVDVRTIRRDVSARAEAPCPRFHGLR